MICICIYVHMYMCVQGACAGMHACISHLYYMHACIYTYTHTDARICIYIHRLSPKFKLLGEAPA